MEIDERKLRQLLYEGFLSATYPQIEAIISKIKELQLPPPPPKKSFLDRLRR